jgi:methionyl aminopeptidase
VSISGPEELEALRAAGALLRRVLEAMKEAVRPGVTTGELDAMGAKIIEENGARSAPATV